MKLSHLFPGQGSQFSGMGRDLYDSCPDARDMMEMANSILGFRITDVMFDGTDDDLRQTKITQPAIYIHSVALAAYGECSRRPDMAAGHSLGEFSALTAAGAISFEDGLKLVAARAIAMQKCCSAVPGTMAAIIGMGAEAVEQACGETEGTVVAANYNCDGQIVISGEENAVAAACARLKEMGAKRALPLSVSGAFHSPLMEPAGNELAEAIRRTEVRKPLCPVFQNVSAKGETDPETIKENMLRQLTSPVKWTQTIKNMLAAGAEEFVEIGPGSVLQGLVKRIGTGNENIVIKGIQ